MTRNARDAAPGPVQRDRDQGSSTTLIAPALRSFATRKASAAAPEGLGRGIERITVADEQAGELRAQREQFGCEIDVPAIPLDGIQARRRHSDLLQRELERGQLQTTPVGREQQQATSRPAQPNRAPNSTRAARTLDDEVVFALDRPRSEALTHLGLCIMARMQPDLRGNPSRVRDCTQPDRPGTHHRHPVFGA